MGKPYFDSTHWPSVTTNFLPHLNEINGLGETPNVHGFLKRFSSGGLIARVFLAHCRWPESIPIFDQHVYRAMRLIDAGRPSELPSSESGKQRAYVDEYMPFIQKLKPKSIRDADRALWTYGKFVKSLA